jgi:hypothetical protein
VTLDKGSRVFGNITAPSLVVGETQHLVGMVVAGPRAAELLAEIDAAAPPPAPSPAKTPELKPQPKKVPA